LLLGKTYANSATAKTLKPLMPVFEIPTISAPATAQIHCAVSKFTGSSQSASKTSRSRYVCHQSDYWG
jgi:hypothetical protein